MSRAFSGRDAANLTADRLSRDELEPDDVRIHPETLEHQAQVAEQHGNPQLAGNFRRAAELAVVPEAEVMAMYEALRPGRSTAAELEALAAQLDGYQAQRCAALVREAAEVYARRGPAGVSIVAGIDVGNSTTEVVLARLGPRTSGGIELIGASRAPTRRGKGSPQSLDGAASLLARLERQHGVRAEQAAVARLRPVETLTASLPEPSSATGRLRVVSAGAATSGGHGVAVGRPHRLGDPVPDDAAPLVAVVPAGFGYREAVERLRGLGDRLVAVALEDDEAVLVSNRLGGGIPVIDEIVAGALLGAELVAIEVAEPGAALRMLTDSLRLATAFGLAPEERSDAAQLALRLADCSNAAVALDRPAGGQAVTVPTAPSGWAELGAGRRVAFPEAHALITSGPAGLACCYALPPDEEPLAVDDLWTVDLTSVADAVLARRAGTGSRAVGLAALRSDAPLTDPSGPLSERLGIPVLAGSESRAGWVGGCSTAGADPDGGQTVVIDLGGGTIDAASASSAVVAAGGGQLLTMAVAALADTTAAAAEWVKRGAAHRVESPQVLLGEDGTRSFLDRPAPSETVGTLVVTGPAGLLPFSRILAPGEWRALRLRLKVEAIGANVARALRTLDARPQTVIVVGGPAGDDEVLSAVARALPSGVAIGRGDVGGQLGHRYAVAYGLITQLP